MLTQNNNQENIHGYTKFFVVILPLIILLLLVALTQAYITTGLPGRFSSAGPGKIEGQDATELLLIGYNYNRNLLTLSLTLHNAGTRQITILNLIYDGHILTQGEIGGRLPTFSSGVNSSSNSLCIVPSSNDLIFPQSDHWNMDTGGLCTPSIPSQGYAQLYLGIGISSNSQSGQALQVSTQEGNFSFTLNNNATE